MVRLDSTATQLLLFVPFSENARAKAIDGRRWEPSRKAWAYPRTAAAYDAIVEEFGPEITDNRAARPTVERRPRPLPEHQEVAADALRRQNEVLAREILGLRESIDKVVASSNSNSKTAELQQAIFARETALSKLRELLAAAQSRIQELELSELKLQQELKDAREARVRRAAERAPIRPTTSQEKGLTGIRNFLQLHLTPESTLLSRLERLSAEEYMCVELGNIVENELRARLGAYEGQTFHDLINHAFDTELLSQEGRDFAHQIRKQRNNVAHDNVAKRSFVLRGAFSLVTAGLLWSEFD